VGYEQGYLSGYFLLFSQRPMDAENELSPSILSREASCFKENEFKNFAFSPESAGANSSGAVRPLGGETVAGCDSAGGPVIIWKWAHLLPWPFCRAAFHRRGEIPPWPVSVVLILTRHVTCQN